MDLELVTGGRMLSTSGFCNSTCRQHMKKRCKPRRDFLEQQVSGIESVQRAEGLRPGRPQGNSRADSLQ